MGAASVAPDLYEDVMDKTEIVAQFKSSDMSKAEFARANNISRATLDKYIKQVDSEIIEANPEVIEVNPEVAEIETVPEKIINDAVILAVHHGATNMLPGVFGGVYLTTEEISEIFRRYYVVDNSTKTQILDLDKPENKIVDVIIDREAFKKLPINITVPRPCEENKFHRLNRKTIGCMFKVFEKDVAHLIASGVLKVVR